MNTQVPLREGLFEQTDSGPTLLASRCTSCGHTAYPVTARCLACGAEEQEALQLGAQGELFCASVVHIGNGRFAPGYVVGYVIMPHGVRVFGQLDTGGEDPPAPGTPMTLEIVPMWQEDGHDVLAPRFVPTARKESTNA